MSFKAGFLLIALFAGSIALPVKDVDQDMSIFFENVDSSARIIGGSPADNVPYMVALTTGNVIRSLLCGGSLIAPNRVLTAAHCVYIKHLSLHGHVGTNRFASGGFSFAFTKRIIHPNYDGGRIKNDISILHMLINVPLSDSVAVVALNWDHVNAGAASEAFGWGITSNNGAESEVLLQLSGKIVDGDECVKQVAEHAVQIGMRAPPVDPRLEICMFNSTSNGMCRGDSGGPLIVDGGLSGVVSWGLPCARGAPDMSARLSAFRPWIEENMQ